MKGKADEKCMWRDYFGDLLNFKDEREAELSYLMKREVRGEKRGELVIVVMKFMNDKDNVTGKMIEWEVSCWWNGSKNIFIYSFYYGLTSICYPMVDIP